MAPKKSIVYTAYFVNPSLGDVCPVWFNMMHASKGKLNIIDWRVQPNNTKKHYPLWSFHQKQMTHTI